MKKTKQPGENISLKTKKSEDPLVMQWINAQTNLMDSIRYLIEIELHHNGVRNLQAFIPAERTFTAAAPPPLAASHPPAEPIQPPAEVNLAAATAAASAAVVTEQAKRQEPEPPVEDDIDDDDIESWT